MSFRLPDGLLFVNMDDGMKLHVVATLAGSFDEVFGSSRKHHAGNFVPASPPRLIGNYTMLYDVSQCRFTRPLEPILPGQRCGL